MPTEQSNPTLALASTSAYFDTPLADLLTELARRIHFDSLTAMRAQGGQFPSPGVAAAHEHLQGTLETLELLDRIPSSSPLASSFVLDALLKALRDANTLLGQIHASDPAVMASVPSITKMLSELQGEIACSHCPDREQSQSETPCQEDAA
jgi:hypothetical protein